MILKVCVSGLCVPEALSTQSWYGGNPKSQGNGSYTEEMQRTCREDNRADILGSREERSYSNLESDSGFWPATPRSSETCLSFLSCAWISVGFSVESLHLPPHDHILNPALPKCSMVVTYPACVTLGKSLLLHWPQSPYLLGRDETSMAQGNGEEHMRH